MKGKFIKLFSFFLSIVLFLSILNFSSNIIFAENLDKEVYTEEVIEEVKKKETEDLKYVEKSKEVEETIEKKEEVIEEIKVIEKEEEKDDTEELKEIVEEEPKVEVEEEKNDEKISYSTHIQNIGWQDFVSDGSMSGTSGKSLRLEGIKIKTNKEELGVEYQTHIQNVGWQGFVSNGALSGTSGKALRLEGIRIRLTGNKAKDYDIYYRVHIENYGWLDWTKNGGFSGSEGMSLRLEAIEIKIMEKGETLNGSTKRAFISNGISSESIINYSSHVQNIGWMKYVGDGVLSGTTGRSLRLEALRIELAKNYIDGTPLLGNIKGKAHIQDIGWTGFSGGIIGTTGRSKRLEGIALVLEGDIGSQYDIYYRVHIEDYGWLNWAKNGELAGSEGYSKRMEAIEIKLISKGGSAPIGSGESFVKYVKPASILLNVPIIRQRPELPTGCEVTALTMLFNYCGINVNKVTLAREMPRHASNPNIGYVGDPFSRLGWTIYPRGFYGLFNKYIGNYHDLTGSNLDMIEHKLSIGKPVVAWVDNFHGFTIHAITLTGYDGKYIYYNDPWTGEKNAKISKNIFLTRWNGEGRKAISYH